MYSIMREFVFTVEYENGADGVMDPFIEYPDLYARSMEIQATSEAVWGIEKVVGPVPSSTSSTTRWNSVPRIRVWPGCAAHRSPSTGTRSSRRTRNHGKSTRSGGKATARCRFQSPPRTTRGGSDNADGTPRRPVPLAPPHRRLARSLHEESERTFERDFR